MKLFFFQGENMLQLKFFGLGGQGVVTAAKMLSYAVSLCEDKYAITVPSYGHERRGAPVFTSIIIDDKPVLLNCFVYEPDIVLAMDDALMEKGIDVSEGKNKTSVLILNYDNPVKIAAYKKLNFSKMYYVDGTQIALKHIGKGIPNGSMLGALACTGIVKIESIESAILDHFGNKAGKLNGTAAREAYENIKCA
jgi:2-oxoacid:acceptor oxidoreductase gamma subunit (pyruvate/2-ketoisovalerate family)